MPPILSYDAGGVAAAAIGEPFGLTDADRAALAEPVEEGFERLRRRAARGEVGFLDLPDRDTSAIRRWAESARDARWTDLAVVGIGGSSLGTRAVLEAAGSERLDGLEPHVFENVDPTSFEALLDEIPVRTTLFAVVTKSGTTVETMGKFAVLYDLLVDEVGRERAADQIVAITDPESGALRRLAEREGFRSFDIPQNVGGRFSVLSPVGLVPLALAGYPVDELLAGARDVRDRTIEASFSDDGIRRATADLYLLQRRGIATVVMMAYADRLSGLVEWFRQLWAESLGKARTRGGKTVHNGTCPVKALGTLDQHSQLQLYREGPADKFVVFVGVDNYDGGIEIPEGPGLPAELSHLAGTTFGEIMRAELDATQTALAEAGRPTARWMFRRIEPRTLGGFLMGWQLVTALVAELVDVDAFDQPGVKLGKEIAHGLLGGPEAPGASELNDDGERAVPILSDPETPAHSHDRRD